jgi:hypothetical protein
VVALLPPPKSISHRDFPSLLSIQREKPDSFLSDKITGFFQKFAEFFAVVLAKSAMVSRPIRLFSLNSQKVAFNS